MDNPYYILILGFKINLLQRFGKRFEIKYDVKGSDIAKCHLMYVSQPVVDHCLRFFEILHVTVVTGRFVVIQTVTTHTIGIQS